MKRNKIFKYINAILLCLPFLGVLFGCCYATFNSNAYLSNDTTNTYYDEVVVDNGYTTNEVNSLSDLVVGNSYMLTLDYSSFATSTSTINFGITTSSTSHYFKLLDTSYNSVSFVPPYTFATSDFTGFRLRFDFTSYTSIAFRYLWNGSTRIASYNFPLSYDFVLFVNILDTSFIDNASFDYLECFNFSILPDYVRYSISYVEKPVNSLNNSFEYGITQFNNIGFDKLNFVNWFTGLFVTNVNNMYVVFINSYLNYMLFVECVIFIPYILLWFVRFCESIINKFLGGAE